MVSVDIWGKRKPENPSASIFRLWRNLSGVNWILTVKNRNLPLNALGIAVWFTLAAIFIYSSSKGSTSDILVVLAVTVAIMWVAVLLESLTRRARFSNELILVGNQFARGVLLFSRAIRFEDIGNVRYLTNFYLPRLRFFSKATGQTMSIIGLSSKDMPKVLSLLKSKLDSSVFDESVRKLFSEYKGL